MKDLTFQWSLTALSIIVVLAVAACATLGLLDVVVAIVIGLVAEIIGGGVLLYVWGRDYMSRH
jgi:hypothetical protein